MTLRSKTATLTAVAASACLSACGGSADVATQAPQARAPSRAAPAPSHTAATPLAASRNTSSPTVADAAPSAGHAVELTIPRRTSARQVKRILSQLIGTPHHVRASHGPGVIESLLDPARKGGPAAAAPRKPTQGGALAAILK